MTTTALDATQPDAALATPGLTRRTLAVFARNKLALTGALVLLALLAFCFLGPLVHPTDQIHTDLSQANRAPGAGHLLGTTDLGYDLLGRLMYGGRTSSKSAWRQGCWRHASGRSTAPWRVTSADGRMP